MKEYLSSYLQSIKSFIEKLLYHEFFYFSNTADMTALRFDEWKISFKTIKGNLFTGTPSSTQAPIVTNLRMDPWERYQDESMNYGNVIFFKAS